jgi:hypothetical protein
MDAFFVKLLSRVYELEGLLLVVEKHDQETPAHVLDMVKEKAAIINEMAQQLALPAQVDQAINALHVAAQQAEQEVEQATDEPADPSMGLPAADYDADETWQHDNGEEFNEMFASGYVEPAPVEASSRVESSGAPMRVEEKLQRDMFKNMRKALSLNDRFRFRRELFGNSDLEMNDALDMIDSMKSYDEATDYFFGDLGWDKDNEEVMAFMEIVQRHFM